MAAHLNAGKTKGERREEKENKKKLHKQSGKSVFLLWRLIVEKAKEVRKIDSNQEEEN